MAKKEPGYWRGFVWGLFTPAIIGVGATVIGTVIALVVGKRQNTLDERE